MVVCALFALAAPVSISIAAPPLRAAGYWVEYDPNSLSAVGARGTRLQWVIATQFHLAGITGGVRGTHNARLQDLAQRQGAEVHMQVSNFLGGDWSRPAAHNILTQHPSQVLTVNDILALLAAGRYAGVSLDFEGVDPADRDVLTAFVSMLASALHAQGGVLSIAVPAKVRDDPANEWNGAFDYAALGRAADRVIVLAYDEHWSTSRPGPVASAPWVDAVAQYAASQIDPAKLLLGIALYGYAWPAQGAAEAVSMRQAIDRAAQAGISISWDSQAQVPFYTLPGATVFFENPRSVAAKLEIAKARGFGGVAFWRLGQEVPDAWSVIDPYLTVERRP